VAPALVLIGQVGSAAAQTSNCAGLPATSGPIPAGTYSLVGSCVVSGTFTISEPVVIHGNGQLVSGSNLRRIFTVTATGSLTLNDIRLTRGFNSTGGGAIDNSGDLVVSGSVLSDNQAGLGGGAVASSGTLTVLSSLFVGNRSAGSATLDSGGGAILSTGNLGVTGTTFVANQSAAAGGAIRSSGSLTVVGSQFLDHVASTQGGAIDASGPLSIGSSLFDGNTSASGGALRLAGPVTADIAGTVFVANVVSGSGGAVAVDGSSISVASSDFVGNRADQHGGAILLAAANLAVTDSAFVDNTGARATSEGGAIADVLPSSTAIDVVRSRFEANRAALGGALHLRNAATLADVALLGNVGTVEGGAMLVRSAVALTRARFEDNASGIGGGIYLPSASGVLDITGAVFRNNRATASSGGALHLNDGGGTITNTTFSGNTAVNGTGGAVFARDTTSPFGTVALRHVTVSGNGNFALSQSNNMVLSLQNSIVAGNGANCNSILTDGGGNLVQVSAGGSCSGIVPASTADPLLGAFTDGYFPLQPGSPAIDGAPDCAGLAIDQRGVGRPQGVACDIGAHEAAPLAPEIFLDGFEPLTPR
jgi:predicted outer membrane repeat protein